MEIRERLGERHGLVSVLHNLAIEYFTLGDSAMARKYYQEALQINEMVGDQSLMASVLINLAELEIAEDNLEIATQNLEKALKLSHEIGYQALIALALVHLGLITFLKQDHSLSIQHLTEAIRVARASGHNQYLSNGLISLIFVYIQQGQGPLAYPYLVEVTQLADHLNIASLKSRVILAAAAWTSDHVQSAEWLGVLSLQEGFSQKQLFRFEDYWEKTRAALDTTSFEAAIARGKAQEVSAVLGQVQRWLAEMPFSSAP